MLWTLYGKERVIGIYSFEKISYFGKVKLMEDEEESNRCLVWSWRHDFYSGAKMVNLTKETNTWPVLWCRSQ